MVAVFIVIVANDNRVAGLSSPGAGTCLGGLQRVVHCRAKPVASLLVLTFQTVKIYFLVRVDVVEETRNEGNLVQGGHWFWQPKRAVRGTNQVGVVQLEYLETSRGMSRFDRQVCLCTMPLAHFFVVNALLNLVDFFFGFGCKASAPLLGHERAKEASNMEMVLSFLDVAELLGVPCLDDS